MGAVVYVSTCPYGRNAKGPGRMRVYVIFPVYEGGRFCKNTALVVKSLGFWLCH